MTILQKVLNICLFILTAYIITLFQKREKKKLFVCFRIHIYTFATSNVESSNKNIKWNQNRNPSGVLSENLYTRWRFMYGCFITFASTSYTVQIYVQLDVFNEIEGYGVANNTNVKPSTSGKLVLFNIL